MYPSLSFIPSLYPPPVISLQVTTVCFINKTNHLEYFKFIQLQFTHFIQSTKTQ